MTRPSARVALRAVAALLCVLPWLRSWPTLPAWAKALTDALFQPLCHHWAGRVLSIGGEAMCVCSRCAGLYAGLALGFALGLPALATGTFRRLLYLALAASLLDVVTQDAGLHPPLHVVRLATGAFAGWVMATWMVQSTAPSRRSPGPAPLG